MSDASAADGEKPQRPWASPRQEPVKGTVQPRVIAPFGKPVRHTNILDYILTNTLKEACRHKHVWPFLKPVDALTLGIPNYHEKITRPMDLKTIESRIKNIYYTSYTECTEDIETVFQNCYIFNGPEDDVTIMAQNVHAVIKKSLENAPSEETEHEISWGKKKKSTKDSSRLAAGAEDRKKKEGSALRTSEPPSECGSEASIMTTGEKTSSKMAVKTMKSGSKRKVESDDDEKPEPIRPAKREASNKKAPTSAVSVPITGRMKFCQKLLNDFYSKKYFDVSWPFHQPVNAAELGLHDYHKIIKTPMDMSTIKKKLETGEYSEPSDFEADFKLMLNNCLLYNPIGDPVHDMGKRFLDVFQKRWKELPSEKGASSSSLPSHPPVLTPITPSAKSSSKSSTATAPVIKQEIKSSPPTLTEGSRARSEDIMRLENALAMIQEKEVSLKTSLKQIEEIKNKVMKYRKSSLDKIPDSLLAQVRNICQSATSNNQLAGTRQITEQNARANGRDIKKIIGYDFDSDCEEAKDDMSYEDKRQLSMLINKLSPEHLATIVQIIERREQHIGARNQEDSEIEIDFEALGPTCLREMNAFARFILKLPPTPASSNNSNSTNPPPQLTPVAPQSSSIQSINLSTPSISAQMPPRASLPNNSSLMNNSEVKSPEKLSMKENTDKKKKSALNISESSDSDPSRKRRKPNSKNTDNSDTGSSSSSSDDDSEDDYRDMEINRKGGIPPYSQGSSSSGAASNHHPGPRLGGMGGQPPMARVPPPLPSSSHQRPSQQVVKKKSTPSTPIPQQQSTSTSNPGKTILDDLLPVSSTSNNQKVYDVDEENEEERIERLRREAKLARQREDENSIGMSNQMEMMTAFEFDNMY